METPEKKEPVTITITFPTNAYFMSGIRDFTLAMVKNMTNFGEQWAFRFQSIIDELCNNAIEFGSAPGKDIKAVFKYLPNEALEITVEDTGTGSSKMKAADMQKLIEERAKPGYVVTGIRGRGLSKIVMEWTDALTFMDLPAGGLQVRVRKNLQNPQANNPQMPASPQMQATPRIVLTA